MDIVINQLILQNNLMDLKIRTMPSPMIVAAYEAYGANPTPIPYMEVYSGLQLKTIDGQDKSIIGDRRNEICRGSKLSNTSVIQAYMLLQPV